MTVAADRREQLLEARLYLVADAGTPDEVLDAALTGGVDMLQLRDTALDDEALLRRASAFRSLCDAHDALFWLNDRPDLTLRAEADGVHLGQQDMPVDEARAVVGPDVLIGLSTHEPAQLDAARSSDADQISVGPVWETPTKPGRPAAGLEYVRRAAADPPPQPWFAIGGIDPSNIDEVVEAGAERIVVVRALCQAADPRATATELRRALEEAPVGAER